MSATAILPETSDPELSDENRVAHIAPADAITNALILGTPVKALCGATFVPSRDPKKYPVCQACKDMYESFILPMRDDHSIKDDL